MPFKKGFDPKRGKGGVRPNSGRPKDETREIFQKIIRDSGMYEKLAKMIQEETGEMFLKASRLALEYGVGKPAQALEVSGKDGQPVQWSVIDYSKAVAS